MTDETTTPSAKLPLPSSGGSYERLPDGSLKLLPDADAAADTTAKPSKSAKEK